MLSITLYSLDGHHVQCGTVNKTYRNGNNDHISDCKVQIGIVKGMSDDVRLSRFGQHQIDALHYGKGEHCSRRYLIFQMRASGVCLQRKREKKRKGIKQNNLQE